MRAFITVIGKDTVGILAKVSSACAEYGINIQEVTHELDSEFHCPAVQDRTDNGPDDCNKGATYIPGKCDQK